MKVLIVEDELLIRQGIEVMVRNSPLDIKQIALAKNGVEALEFLKSNTVDIMITDVKMPQMDGIDLVKHVNELPDKPFIIVVTGFSDFQYVVEMLRYGANDYLLKPVDRAYLHGTLEKLAGQSRIKVQEKRNRKEVIEYQLNKYLSTGENGQMLFEMIEDYIPEGIQDIYVNCIQNTGDSYSALVDCGIMNGNQFLITKQPINANTSVLVSISDTLLDAFREAKTLREYHFFEADRPRDAIDFVMIPEMHRKHINASIAQKDPFLEKYFVELCRDVQKHKMSPNDVDQIMKFYFRAIMETYERFSEGSKSYSLLDMMAYKNSKEYSEALRIWEQEFFEVLNQEFEDFQTKRQIQDAINYIELNYHEPINMAVVSNEVSMNYTMFSHCFKYYVGQNFVAYLRTLRLNKAKKLLKETDMMVKEICENVGFTDTKHFMKLFKTECGVSPSQYRRSIKKA